jgi:hypothetical protein
MTFESSPVHQLSPIHFNSLNPVIEMLTPSGQHLYGLHSRWLALFLR